MAPFTKVSLLIAAVLAATAGSVLAQSAEGGLYIAGDGFSFKTAAERGLAQNPGGRRFFLLTLPPQAASLRLNATPAQARQRERVIAGNGVLLVCQRDLDNGRIATAGLADGVVPVRGWPGGGESAMPPGQRHHADENPALLPESNDALRRLRSTCS